MLLDEIISSSLSGLVSRVICHPLDTVKSRMQSGRYNSNSIKDIIMKTYKIEGLHSFYKGLGAVIVGGVPGVCIYLTSYEIIKRKLSDINSPLKGSSFAIYFSSGMIAEGICCLLFVPVDVVKERLQVQSYDIKNINNNNIKYNSSIDAFTKIIKNEGFNGLYKGYAATMMSYGPFSAFYFLFYEEMKKICIKSNSKDKDITFIQSLFCSAGAGAIASYITNPLDLIKLRLQIQSSDKYNNMWQSMKLIIKEEGVAGLFRGAWARVLFHCPNTAICMGCYESCIQLLRSRNHH